LPTPLILACRREEESTPNAMLEHENDTWVNGGNGRRTMKKVEEQELLGGAQIKGI
jgi:hypothetical protein